MWNRIDEKTRLEIFITSLATITSLFFISISYLYEQHAIKILSLLIIILPTIYIIGNLIAKALLKHGFDRWMEEVHDGLEEVEDENTYLKELLNYNNIEYNEESEKEL